MADRAMTASKPTPKPASKKPEFVTHKNVAANQKLVAAGAKHAVAKGTPAKPAVPAKPGNPNITPPRLTAAQMERVRQYDEKYGMTRSGLERRVSDAANKTNLSLSQNTKSHDQSVDRANQAYAARGLFQSSVRDSDLNDLDAALTMRNNVLNTNLQVLTTDTNRHVAALDTDYAVFHNQYDQAAAANAQAQTPTQPTPGTPAKPAVPAIPPNEFVMHNNIPASHPLPPEQVIHQNVPLGAASGLAGAFGHPPVIKTPVPAPGAGY